MLPSGRLFYKKTDSIPKLLYSKVKVDDVNASNGKKIFIPPRIERKPTDILKALASTVSTDPTAFHYKYPDDPYMYPENKREKKLLALALESGRNSAKWIINENPGFFKHQLADPPIKVFLRKSQEATGAESMEQDLLNAIEERNVLEAIKAYRALKEKQQDVPKSTKQSLLELVCFYNSKAKPDLDVESKWFTKVFTRNDQAAGDLVVDEKWDEKNFIKSLFDEMDPNCPLAVSAVIQGMLKHGDIQSAVELYEEAKVKNIKLSVGVYNALLEQSQQIMTARNESLNYVKEKVNEMADAGIKPNLGTLNAALMALQNTTRCKWGLGLVAELENLGIQPSLGTYGYLIKILAKLNPEEIEYSKQLTEKIMKVIENENHEILHPSDLEFFHMAIRCFVEIYSDANLAVRLAEMYLRFNNSKFVVKQELEAFLFKRLMEVCLREKPIQDTMKIYRRFFSTVYNTTIPVLLSLLKEIHENFSPEYLPEIWEDIRRSGFIKNRRVLGGLLHLAKDFTDETSLKIFHEAALAYVNDLRETRNTMGFEGLEGVLVALIKNDDEKTIISFMEVKKNLDLEFQNVTADFAESFIDYGLSKKNTSFIVEGLKLSSEYEFPFVEEKVEKALPLLSEYDAEWARGLLNQIGKGENKKKKQELKMKEKGKSEEEEEV